jgi:hypothetical protein
VLEFKGRLSTTGKDGPVDLREVAKDVAAFANALGGVILVGADEDKKRGLLGQYRRLTAEEAKATRDACGEAVETLCSPKPMFEMVNVPSDAGVVVVVVNVWPFPGQAVGVRTEPNGFSFPVRTGADTIFLLPEQLPMLMLPELRRVVTLLRAIPEGATIAYNHTAGQEVHSRPRFVRVDERDNVVRLISEGGTSIVIALDFIKAVWKAEDMWHVTAGPWL